MLTVRLLAPSTRRFAWKPSIVRGVIAESLMSPSTRFPDHEILGEARGSSLFGAVHGSPGRARLSPVSRGDGESRAGIATASRREAAPQRPPPPGGDYGCSPPHEAVRFQNRRLVLVLRRAIGGPLAFYTGTSESRRSVDCRPVAKLDQIAVSDRGTLGGLTQFVT
jgi:hypothetical protein